MLNFVKQNLLKVELIYYGIDNLPTLYTQDASYILSVFKYCFANAPAITLPIVYLADDLPPPDAALIPYFFKYV